MNIEIVETTSTDATTVANLYQFYLYDFSEMVGFSVEADGRYEVGDDLEGCWTDDNRHAFLLKVEDEIAGFAVVDERGKHHPDGIDMAEFFVLRKFRRHGVGAWFATQLFSRFQGKWRVAQLEENVSALHFWRKVIGAYTSGQFEDTTWTGVTRTGTVQYFTSR